MDVELSPIFIRSPYNYDMDAASDASAMVDNGEPSPTVQSEKDNSDINTIVKRFGLTGAVPSNPRLPLEEDFMEVTDYHSAMNAIRNAERSFMQIPAEIRAKFDNDPQKFADFCLDPENLDEIDKLGLANDEVRAKLLARNKAREEEELQKRGRVNAEVKVGSQKVGESTEGSGGSTSGV